MRRISLAVSVLALAAPAPPAVRATSLPRTAVVGSPWTIVLRAAKAPTVVATGPSTLRAKAGGKPFRARLTFPRAGTWQIAAVLGGKTTRLGAVSVDVARDALLADPFTIAVEPSGPLLVGQRETAPLVRLGGGRAVEVAQGVGIYHVAVTPSGTYVTASDGAAYRLEGTRLVRATPDVGAGAVAADAAGNVYTTSYDEGSVKRVTPGGVVSSIASGLNHPHSLALGADGALYVADTENRRLRRVDLATGSVTTFGGDVGITVSVAVAPDGSVYSVDVVRDGAGGGVTRTTPDGVTTRVLTNSRANAIAVAPDGTVYVNLWEGKRIDRLDPRTGTLEAVARG